MIWAYTLASFVELFSGFLCSSLSFAGEVDSLGVSTMRFTRFPFHPRPMLRTARKIKNAQRAVQRELDSVPLFPALARFSSAEERLDQIDACMISYWRRMRDNAARTWRKFRRRLLSLSDDDIRRFLNYWDSHLMIPGDACYASDTLTNFFSRDDWRNEDIREIQGGSYD